LPQPCLVAFVKVAEITRRLVQQRHDGRRLERREAAHVGDAEELARGAGQPVYRAAVTGADVHGVRIRGEDRVLRMLALDRHRDADLVQLAAKRPAALVQHIQARHLHRDRRRAPAGDRHAREPREIDAVMRPERSIFARDHRVEERRARERRVRHRIVRRSGESAVRIGHRRDDGLGLDEGAGERLATGPLDSRDRVAAPPQPHVGQFRISRADRDRLAVHRVAAAIVCIDRVIADAAEVILESGFGEALSCREVNGTREDAKVALAERWGRRQEGRAAMVHVRDADLGERRGNHEQCDGGAE
jgi:hypothetical protein